MVALWGSTSLSCTGAVIAVYISPDSDGARRPSPAAGQALVEFPSTTPAVYCIAEYSNGRDDATIEALLHQESVINTGTGEEIADRDVIIAAVSERAAIGAQQKLVLALVPSGDKQPLAAGQYRCEFALLAEPAPPNTKPKWDGVAQFRISNSVCPPTQITTGDDCTMYVDRQDACPADGARSERQDNSPPCFCVPYRSAFPQSTDNNDSFVWACQP